jgi:NTE family protein
MSNNYNLVLSGGGARAYAHLGAIKALKEIDVTFNSISATSAGSVIGAFLCDGFSIEEIVEILEKNKSLVNFNYSIKGGLLSNDKLTTLLKNNLRSKNFETLKIPLFISATNLNNGNQQIFENGNIIDAILASSSIPLLYQPIIINEVPYGDGGICSNLPVEPFYNSNLKVIAIHVNPMSEFDEHKNVIFQFERFIHLCIKENTLRNIQKIDILIEPNKLSEFGLFDFKRMDDIMEIGYNYTTDLIKKGTFIFEKQ